MVIKNRSLGRFWPIFWTITQFWVPEVISTIDEPLGAFTCRSSGLTILPILVCFVHYYSPFWGPRAISTIDDPRLSLRIRRQHSKFWPILTRLVDYYSPFWCPEVISIVVESQGALTCRSSTLAVLADSGLFHGLLLTVLMSRSDFHGCRTP